LTYQRFYHIINNANSLKQQILEYFKVFFIINQVTNAVYAKEEEKLPRIRPRLVK